MQTDSVPMLLGVAAVMFAWAPWVIDAAPYESTMGLVQKIFYFHVPSAMTAMLLGVRLRHRQRVLSVRAGARAPIVWRSRRPNSSWCSA